MNPANYNYASFPADDDVEFFTAFSEILKPGEKAPDPELIDLDTNEPVRLSTVTSRHALTAIELGSLT